MVWGGVIIEESLENKELMNFVKIINTKKATLEGEEGKGFLQFHLFELDNDKKEKFIDIAKKDIKRGWYTHLCKDGKMIVIFKEKVFSFTKNDQEKINEARNYGLSMGILKEQMDFEHLIDNPHD